MTPGLNSAQYKLSENIKEDIIETVGVFSGDATGPAPSPRPVSMQPASTHLSPRLVGDTKQFDGYGEQAQVYGVIQDVLIRYSNANIIKTVQNPDKPKMSHELSIKPKGGKAFILDGQNNDSHIKDFVADQYFWLGDTTNASNHSGISLIKKKNITMCMIMTLVYHMQGKYPTERNLEKTVSYIQPSPFLWVVEYTGNEHACKPTSYGNAKDNIGKY